MHFHDSAVSPGCGRLSPLLLLLLLLQLLSVAEASEAAFLAQQLGVWCREAPS